MPRLSSPLPAGSVPLDGEPATPEWEAFLEDEEAFVAADWECRKDVRAGLADAVEEALDGFEAEHADEVDAAREHWAGVRQEAAELGWAPGT